MDNPPPLPPGDNGPRDFDSRLGAQVSQAIVAGSADGILAVDEDGVIQFCNPAAQELLARTDEQLIGSPFGHPLVAGEAIDIDVRLPDGRTRVVELRTATTTWEGRPLTIAALRDVTGYRDIERALEESLRHHTSVAGITAHEFRNPLVAITMCANMLRNPAITPTKRTETINTILEHTKHLQNVVHQFLTASRVDALATRTNPESVRVLDVLLERLAEFKERSRASEIVCPPALRVYADRTDFSEMIANYLANALAYGRPPITIDVSQQGDNVDICVRDRGRGVPKQFIPHLFERFSREPVTQRTTEGTGLGLWIVRNLARANKGDAWYEPDPRAGARFYLRLPTGPQPAQD
jgi:signal transduction histidine kinase